MHEVEFGCKDIVRSIVLNELVSHKERARFEVTDKAYVICGLQTASTNNTRNSVLDSSLLQYRSCRDASFQIKWAPCGGIEEAWQAPPHVIVEARPAWLV